MEADGTGPRAPFGRSWLRAVVPPGAARVWRSGTPHASAGPGTSHVLEIAPGPAAPPTDDGEALDLGGGPVRRVARDINTPHMQDNWEARPLHEQTTSTPPCGPRRWSVRPPVSPP
ncbi:hypothetical protein [Streptomyces sp. NPDC001153]